MRTLKCIASVIATVMVLSFGNLINAQTVDSVTFSQSFIFTNENTTEKCPNISYEYYVDGNVDTSFSTYDGLSVVKAGSADDLSLSTSTIDLSSTSIPGSAVDYTLDYNITINFGTYSSDGVYRYRLVRSDSTGDSKICYFDVYVSTSGSEYDVIGCNFYDSDFSSTEQSKITGFEDRYVLSEEGTVSYNQQSLIRFEDEEGNKLFEDIPLYNYITEEPSGRVVPVKAASRPVKAAGLNLIKNSASIDIDTGLTTYEQNLQTLLDQGYVVVNDEVAINRALENPVWFSDDHNETLIFHVTMRAPEAPVGATFRVRIAKVDFDNIAYYLRDAEFTIYRSDGSIMTDENGNPCVGVTGEDGYLEFRIINDGDSYYIQETRAPAGYELNTDKFPITPTVDGAEVEDDGVILVPIMIRDRFIVVIPPKTGDDFNIVYYSAAGIVGIGLFTAGIIYLKKRKEIN